MSNRQQHLLLVCTALMTVLATSVFSMTGRMEPGLESKCDTTLVTVHVGIEPWLVSYSLDGGASFTSDTLIAKSVSYTFDVRHGLIAFYNLESSERFTLHVPSGFADSVQIDLANQVNRVSPQELMAFSRSVESFTRGMHNHIVANTALQSGNYTCRELTSVFDVIEEWESKSLDTMARQSRELVVDLSTSYRVALARQIGADTQAGLPVDSICRQVDTVRRVFSAFCESLVDRAFMLLYSQHRCARCATDTLKMRQCLNSASKSITGDNMGLLLQQLIVRVSEWEPQTMSCEGELHRLLSSFLSTQPIEIARPVVRVLDDICMAESLASLSPITHIITPSGEQAKLNLDRDSTYLIRFWGTWCASCMQVLPESREFDSVLIANGGRVIAVCVDALNKYDRWRVLTRGWPGNHLFVTFDIQEDLRITSQLQINSYPYYVAWKEGKGILVKTPYKERAGAALIGE